MSIRNPILPGFNPDPCICRKGDDYYLAVSTFEWFPAIPVYHSRDLKHWELLTHILTDDERVNLKNLPSAKGLWAPCLTWCAEEDLFYLAYGVMNSMNARYFDIDNYLITAKDICGPWSEPVYLHSAGFDASMLHDDDGKKYVVSLEWETRDGYEKPGAICVAEYDPIQKAVIGYPKRVWRGATDRGCLEGPHLTKRNGWYYLMCAEGGTGYYHCASMARSRNVMGPYEADPNGPILTAQPAEVDERKDIDHLKPRYYNPDAPLQKSGHGSYVDLPTGETYLVHICARPFAPELRCTLGRETSIQKMRWTEDGWLRLADGGNIARLEVPESALQEAPVSGIPAHDDFDGSELGNWYYAPRQMPERFADVAARPGWVRLRGQESQASTHRFSFLARKLTSVNVQIITKMEFHPEVYQHNAGLILYYDNMNSVFLRKYYSQTLDGSALSIVRIENGVKSDYPDTCVPAPEGPVWLRLTIRGREHWFEWSADGVQWTRIGSVFDTTKYSDEYSEYGEFTGTMVGVACVDSLFHRQCADFDFFACHEDSQFESFSSPR